MRRARTVELSPEERAVLQRRTRGGRRGGQAAQRAFVVLRAAEGRRDIDIARETGLHRLTVARWRSRFLEGRLQGLEDATPVTPGHRLPSDRLAAIARATVARTPPGPRGWSTRTLARAFGVSHMTVRRVWESHRIRPARFGVLPLRMDPVRPRVAGDVVGVLLDPPLAAIAVTLHTTPVRAPGDPTSALGGPGALRPPYAERGVVAPISVPLPSEESRRYPLEPRLLRFLAALERNAPRTSDLGVVALSPHGLTRHEIDEWRRRHPRLVLEWSEDRERWRERVADRLAEAGHRPVPRNQFHGPGETSRSLARFLLEYEPSGGPYRWVAAPSEIARGEAAYRLRYDLAVTGHTGFKRPPPVPAHVRPRPTTDEPARAMARALVRQYLRLRTGERLTVESWTETLSYSNAIVLEALRVGARPMVLYQDEPTYWAATTEVPAGHLAAIGDHRKAALERTDAFVSFFGPSDRERFHALTPSMLFKLGAYQDALYQAASKGRARAVQMAIGRVSEASARMYGVEAGPWREELVAGTLVAPATLGRRARPIVGALRTGHEVRISHPNGTDLRLRLRKRTPVVSDGTVTRAERAASWSVVTLPAGVVTVAVDESVAEGRFVSNQPSAVGLSDTVGEMRGARWSFANGRLLRATYDAGLDLFEQSRARAGPVRDRPASFSIGLNEHLHRAPLLEDQALGTVTMHLGANEYLGGRSAGSWVAWAFLRGATVAVDGDPIVREGRLVG